MIKLIKSTQKTVSFLKSTPILEKLIQFGFKFKSPYLIDGRIKILNPEFKNPDLIIIEYESDEDLKLLEQLELIKPQKFKTDEDSRKKKRKKEEPIE